MNRPLRGWVVALSAALLVATAPAALAAKSGGARQYAYPGYDIQWVKKIGLPDATGAASQGLRMEKTDATASGADTSAGAGLAITDRGTIGYLAFAVRLDGECGASPHFRLQVAGEDGYRWFRCGEGVQTPVVGHPGWALVEFPQLDAPVETVDLRLRFTLPEGTAAWAVVDDIAYGASRQTATVITKAGGN